MKSRRRKTKRRVTQAAGGIVTRRGRRALIAVVQRRKDRAWVLPRGKLKRGESAIAAARREVIEETGENVRVREYLGGLSYRGGGKTKIVQFWRMQSKGGKPLPLMRDIRAVDWLPPAKAVSRLNDPLERAFLDEIWRRAIRKRRTTVAGKAKRARRRKRR